jgi:hypothetical protein
MLPYIAAPWILWVREAMFDSEAEGELSQTKLLEPGQWRANRTERGALTRQAKICQGRPRQSSVTYQLAGDRGFNHFLKFSDPKRLV